VEGDGDVFNVGVIGVGMGEAHVRGYTAIPDVRVMALADIAEERARDCAARYQVPRVFTEYRELLALPEIDAVSVCLPNDLHAPATIAALQAGKHVLCEKPMARSLAEAEAMTAAARETGRTLAISVNYRWSWSPDSWYLKELIDSGRLGEIYYVRAVSLRRRTFVGGHRSWFTQKKRSGGAALTDMGPHLLDLAMWLANDYSPVQVSGVTRTAIMTDTDVDDFSTALVRLKGGAAISLESTWASFTREGLTITVFGTQGGAILDQSQPAGKRLALYMADGDTELDYTPHSIVLRSPREATVQEHFVRSLQAGRQPENSMVCGLAVMRIIDAVYRSSATGRDIILES
jgi:predicted dehydrogenase